MRSGGEKDSIEAPSCPSGEAAAGHIISNYVLKDIDRYPVGQGHMEIAYHRALLLLALYLSYSAKRQARPSLYSILIGHLTGGVAST